MIFDLCTSRQIISFLAANVIFCSFGLASFQVVVFVNSHVDNI